MTDEQIKELDIHDLEQIAEVLGVNIVTFPRKDPLLDQLIGILQQHAGESGNSEGAVETLERIIRERDGIVVDPGIEKRLAGIEAALNSLAMVISTPTTPVYPLQPFNPLNPFGPVYGCTMGDGHFVGNNMVPGVSAGIRVTSSAGGDLPNPVATDEPKPTPIQEFLDANRDHNLVIEGPRRSGKSFWVMREANRFAMANPGSTSLITCTSYPELNDIASYLEDSSGSSRERIGITRIKYINGSSVYLANGSQAQATHGLSLNRLFISDAQDTDKKMWDAIFPYILIGTLTTILCSRGKDKWEDGSPSEQQLYDNNFHFVLFSGGKDYRMQMELCGGK